MRTIIELTADGSHTLFVPDLNEHYHSVNGAVQESKHVFIEAGLNQIKKDTISIFEVGFGTGLNAFLTLLEGEKTGKQINHTTIEAFPLDMELVEKLNFSDETDKFNQLHSCDWNVEAQITNYFSLNKIKKSLLEYNFEDTNETFDLIYFDAFAPDKQPEMWTQDIFDKLYSKCNPNAILVTYCAKGSVRRMLQQSGFRVERIPGPPGKREMLRARKD